MLMEPRASRDLSLGLGGLLAGDQLVAAGLELGELVLHLGQALLEALGYLALRLQGGFLGLDLVLELDLLADGDLGQVIPLVGPGLVTGGAQRSAFAEAAAAF